MVKVIDERQFLYFQGDNTQHTNVYDIDKRSVQFQNLCSIF